MKKIAIALLLGAAFVMGGCGDKAEDGKDAKSASASSSGDAKKDAKKDDKAAGGDTGIKECDDYIAAFAKCDKMPAESKKAMEDGKAGWKQAADAGGAAKDAAAQGCKAGLDAMKSVCP